MCSVVGLASTIMEAVVSLAGYRGWGLNQVGFLEYGARLNALYRAYWLLATIWQWSLVITNMALTMSIVVKIL